VAKNQENQTPEVRESLLKAVCEQPDNDSPRLRYAEFLESTGESDDVSRAELIRVQIELAKPDLTTKRWHELDTRKDAHKPNLERWAADELPKLEGVLWFSHDYKRGFVWSINCSDEVTFQEHAKKIFASAPIQSISFSDVQSIKNIVEVPEFVRISRLILEGFNLGPAEAQVLASSPNVKNLRALHLSGNRFGDAGTKALAASPHFRRLDNLNLGENGIGDEGVKALSASPVVSSLTHLGLAGNRLTDVGAIALASSPHLNRITGMTLWECNRIGTKGQAALKKRFGSAVSFMD
jgi:uncharacterized protein (TIGR02996 family)